MGFSPLNGMLLIFSETHVALQISNIQFIGKTNQKNPYIIEWNEKNNKLG